MPFIASILLTVIFLLHSADALASGAVVRQRQMKEMRQQAMEQQYAQEMAQQQQMQAQAIAQQQMVAQVQQQQMQQAAAQQIAMAQAQQYIAAQMQQQQMMAAAQQMLVQVQQQKQTYVHAVQTRQMNEAVDQQQAAMIASMTQQYQQAIIQEAIKQKMTLEASQMAQIQDLARAKAEAMAMQAMQMKQQVEASQIAQQVNKNRPFEPNSNDVQDVVDITDVWRKLDVDSRGWTLLIDNQAKVATISEYMDRFRKQGVKIQTPPIDYVQMIDDLAMQNPTLLTRPFKDVLQLVAVMQYDFDNGMDKDVLAQKMLGQQLYLSNRKRLGH